MSLKYLMPVFAVSSLFLIGCNEESSVLATGSDSLSSIQGDQTRKCHSDSLDDKNKDTMSVDTLLNDTMVIVDTTAIDTLSNDTSTIDNLNCSAPALVVDESTLYMQELENTPVEGRLVPGVCGNGLALSEGESASLNIVLTESMPSGTIEFWFKPDADFFNEDSRTLLGNDESRAHFFVKNGELIFQKNHSDIHYFVKGQLDLDSGWNLIAGQWGNGYLSLFLNGKLLAAVPHTEGYAPSTRFSMNSNRFMIGTKSYCCMEALGQYSSMNTSGSFDQVRVSDKARYTVNLDKNVTFDSLDVKNVKDAQINFGLLSDSSFYATSQSSLNLGGLVCLTASAYDNNTLMRSLYQFSIDTLPEGAVIDSAIFILSIDSWKQKRVSTDETFVIHKILSSWNEGTGTSSGCSELGTVHNSASINGVTAVERYYGTEWSGVGLGLNDSDASSKIYSSVVIPNYSKDQVVFNVTELVSEWVKNPSSNNGMLLRNLSETSGRFPNIPLFVSGNSANADGQPVLKLYYHY